MNYIIQDLKEKNLIIFEAIMGSRAYGTSLPTSDIDIRGVYIQPLDDILSFGYIEQVSDKLNDIVFYEIKRFLELVASNNPNILELLNAPEDCIVFKDPIFDLIINQKQKFISKICKMSFGGYAIGQIKKARGYNKKINWEKKEMVRKTVLDFCYILEDGKTLLLEDWLKTILPLDDEPFTYKDFALAKVDHAHDIYAMYNMFKGDNSGIVSNPETANDVQLFSIPKDREMDAYLTFNKDAYSIHCKKFKEYNEWLENRNENRFKMNKEHGKNFDSKNMMHCIRILDMGLEIANQKEIIVRRPNRDLLMSIRKGEMEYETLLQLAEEKIKLLDLAFANSNLPNNIDKKFVNDLLITIRKNRYNLK